MITWNIFGELHALVFFMVLIDIDIHFHIDLNLLKSKILKQIL